MICEKCGREMERQIIIDELGDEPAIIHYMWICEPCNYVYYDEVEVK